MTKPLTYSGYLRSMRVEVLLPHPLWQRSLAVARRRGVTSLSCLLVQLLEEAVEAEAATAQPGLVQAEAQPSAPVVAETLAGQLCESTEAIGI